MQLCSTLLFSFLYCIYDLFHRPVAEPSEKSLMSKGCDDESIGSSLLEGDDGGQRQRPSDKSLSWGGN